MWTKTLATHALAALLLATPFLVAASTAGAQGLGMVYAADGTLFYGGNWYHHRNPLGQPTQIYRVSSGSIGGDPQPGAAGEVVIWSGTQRLSDLSLSADGQLLAFREHTFEENVKPAEANYTTTTSGGGFLGPQTSYHFEDAVLKVVTRDGVELLSIPRVRAYTWSDSGQRIGLITGDYTEGSPGFVSTGTWLVEVGGLAGPVQLYGGGYDLGLEPKGEGLFAWDEAAAGSGTGVFYCDPKDGSVTASARQGVRFSPEGTYYYRPSYDGSDFRLYESASDRDLTASLGFFASAPLRVAQPRGWLGDTLLIVPNGDEDLVIDLVEGFGLETGGRVLGPGAAEGSVVILDNLAVATVSMKNLPKVYPVYSER